MSDPDAATVNLDESGIWTYRASGLYNCTTALLAHRLGITGSSPPGWLQERFDEGHRYEPVILERTRRRGFLLAGLQDECVKKIGAAQIKGHIDALGYLGIIGPTVDSVNFVSTNGVPQVFHGEGAVMIDAKAFAQSTWEEWNRGIAKGDVWERFPYYAWQLSFYSHCYGGIPIAMAIGLKDREVPEDILLDYRLDMFTEAPIPMAKIVARVLQIEALAKKGMEGLPEKCDKASYPCPFFNMPFHTDKANDVPEYELDEGQMARLITLTEQRLSAQRSRDEFNKMVEAIDLEIRDLVGDKPGKLKLGKLSETVSSFSLGYHGYTSVNWQKLTQDHPLVKAELYKETSQSSKPTVRVNGKRSV